MSRIEPMASRAEAVSVRALNVRRDQTNAAAAGEPRGEQGLHRVLVLCCGSVRESQRV